MKFASSTDILVHPAERLEIKTGILVNLSGIVMNSTDMLAKLTGMLANLCGIVVNPTGNLRVRWVSL